MIACTVEAHASFYIIAIVTLQLLLTWLGMTEDIFKTAFQFLQGRGCFGMQGSPQMQEFGLYIQTGLEIGDPGVSLLQGL